MPKGIYKRTEEHNRKIGLSHKGMPSHRKGKTYKDEYGEIRAKEISNKISKTETGKKLNIETKTKISKKLKGKKVSTETKLKLSKSNKGQIPWITGKHHSLETKKKLSELHKGNKNPQWKGGITPEIIKIRSSIKMKEWKQKIFIRDNFTCQRCGQKGNKLNAHHIIRFSVLIDEARKYLPLLNLFDAAMAYTPLWDIEIGKTLCENCHKAIRKIRGNLNGF